METLLLLGAGAGIAALVLGTKKKTPQQKFIDTATPREKKIIKEEVERVEKLIENKQKVVVHAIKQKEAEKTKNIGEAWKKVMKAVEEGKGTYGKTGHTFHPKVKPLPQKWNSRDPDGPLSSDECRQVKTILAKGQCIVSKDPAAGHFAVVGWDAPQKRIDRELRTHGWTSHGEFIRGDFGGLRTKIWMCPPGKIPILTPLRPKVKPKMLTGEDEGEGWGWLGGKVCIASVCPNGKARDANCQCPVHSSSGKWKGGKGK